MIRTAPRIAALALAVLVARPPAAEAAESNPPEWAPYANPTVAAIAQQLRRPLGESYAAKVGPTKAVLVVAPPLPEYDIPVSSTRLRLVDTIDSNVGMGMAIGYTVGWASATTYMLGPAAIAAFAAGFMVDAKIESLSKEGAAAAAQEMRDLMPRLATLDATPVLLDALKAAAARSPMPFTSVEAVPADAKSELNGDSTLVLFARAYVPVERDRVVWRIFATLFHRQLGPEHVVYAHKGKGVPSRWDQNPLAIFIVDGKNPAVLEVPIKDEAARAELMTEAARRFPLKGLVGARYNEMLNNRLVFEREIKRDDWSPRSLGHHNALRWSGIEDEQLRAHFDAAARAAVDALVEDMGRLTPAKAERPFRVLKPKGVKPAD